MVKTPLPQGFLPIPPLESGDRLNRYEFVSRKCGQGFVSFAGRFSFGGTWNVCGTVGTVEQLGVKLTYDEERVQCLPY